MVFSRVPGTVTLLRMCESSPAARWVRSDRGPGRGPIFLISGRFIEEMRGPPPNLHGVTRSSPPKPALGGPRNRAEVHQRYHDK